VGMGRSIKPTVLRSAANASSEEHRIGRKHLSMLERLRRGKAAMVLVSARSVTRMPKWVIYCAQCNRPATYVEIDSASIDLADPTAKKPILRDEGDRWDCPFCKKESRVRGCDLTYSYA